MGQIQGVVWLATEDAERWFSEPATKGPEPTLTAEELREAGKEVNTYFAKTHAALNTGKYDQPLVDAGFAGAQGKPKEMDSGRSFVTTLPHRELQPASTSVACAIACGGVQTLIGSISAARKKEVENVPGAAAGEAAKEFVEPLLNASESSEKTQQKKGVKRTRRFVSNQ